MKSTAKVLGALVVGMFAAGGCSASVEEPTQNESDLPQGLTVLERTETSLSVAYRESDVVIYMQALRGKLAPEHYLEALNMPLYEIDTRFEDANGFIFYIAQGGHEWLEPSWGTDLERQMAMDRPPTASNEVLFRLATEAAETMREDISLQIGGGPAFDLTDEIDSIVNVAAGMHQEYIHQFEVRNQERVEKGLGPIPRLDRAAQEIAYGTPGPDDPYYHLGDAASYKIELRADALDGIPGYAGGYHSATSRRALLGNVYYAWDTCNHGRCASTMNFRSGSGSVAFAANELQALHCSGEYKWDSDGGDYGHNCHDDSRIQMHNFKYRSWMSKQSRWCNGSDSDWDISVDILCVELDQSGYPSYSSDANKGYGSSACAYTMGCSSSWMGVGDGCDCNADGTWCSADTDCGSKPASTVMPRVVCDYTLGCSSSWMGAGDGCDCNADGNPCVDADCN